MTYMQRLVWLYSSWITLQCTEWLLSFVCVMLSWDALVYLITCQASLCWLVFRRCVSSVCSAVLCFLIVLCSWIVVLLHNVVMSWLHCGVMLLCWCFVLCCVFCCALHTIQWSFVVYGVISMYLYCCVIGYIVVWLCLCVMCPWVIV